jgi:hypothetical protein
MPYRMLVACVVSACLIAPAAARASDTTPPHTTITQYPGVGETPTIAWQQRWGDIPFRRVYWPDDAVIAFQADEPATFQCRDWNGAWYACASPLTRPTLSIGMGGEHLFIRAIDQAGNVEPVPAHAIWSIDPPSAIVPASVTGTYKVGQVLTCDGGQWPTPLMTPSRKEWLRDEAALMKTIVVATGDTYTVTPDDVGKTMYCSVTLYESGASSGFMGFVAWTPRIPERAAQLPASPACGTSEPATGSDAGTEVRLDRQCRVRVTSDESSFYLDSDGDASTGDPAHGGADRSIRFAAGTAILSYWDGGDFAEASVLESDGSTTWTGKVSALGLVPGKTATLRGAGGSSVPLAVAFTPPPAPTPTPTPTPVPTPTPTPNPRDRTLNLAPLRPARPALVTRPALTGKRAVGHRLRCSKGRWTGSSKIAYRWTRNGKVIKGETASAYTVRWGDRGARIGCMVTARGKGGATTAAARTVAIKR